VVDSADALNNVDEVCAAHPEVVTCVDVRGAFEAADAQGIPGDQTLFVDYCHPAFGRGADLIADSFAGALVPWLAGS
jgi:hypothetical protein